MDWIQAHSLMILGCWAGVGLICGSIGEALPSGKAKTALMTVAHVSPANLASAVKAFKAAS